MNCIRTPNEIYGNRRSMENSENFHRRKKQRPYFCKIFSEMGYRFPCWKYLEASTGQSKGAQKEQQIKSTGNGETRQPPLSNAFFSNIVLAPSGIPKDASRWIIENPISRWKSSVSARDTFPLALSSSSYRLLLLNTINSWLETIFATSFRYMVRGEQCIFYRIFYL